LDLRASGRRFGGSRKFYEELGQRLRESVAISARYDSVRDKDGETRRERNESFAVESPEVGLPDDAEELWSWFWSIRRGVAGGFSGASPVSCGELFAWLQLTGNILRREEVEIIFAMDTAYCEGIALESDAIREREADE
jgi:hypothetical protein